MAAAGTGPALSEEDGELAEAVADVQSELRLVGHAGDNVHGALGDEVHRVPEVTLPDDVPAGGELLFLPVTPQEKALS